MNNLKKHDYESALSVLSHFKTGHNGEKLSQLFGVPIDTIISALNIATELQGMDKLVIGQKMPTVEEILLEGKKRTLKEIYSE